MEPTQLDLAFALVINRLKPTQKSVREFILDLRKHIYPGIRPQFSATHEESRHNYINAALYFEAKQRESERQNEILLNEVASLKRQLAALGEVPTENQWTTRSSKKRKRASADQKSDSHGEDIMKQLEQLADQYQNRDKNESCMHLLRKLFDLQSAMNEFPIQHMKLYEHLRNTCTGFCVVLSDITKGETHKRDQVFQGLSRVLAIMFLVFKEIRLFNDTEQSGSEACREQEQSLNNKLIYDILTIFRVLLDTCHRFSTENSRRISLRELKKPSKQSDVHASTDIDDLNVHLSSLGRTFLVLILKARYDAEASNDTRLNELFSAILEGSLYMLLTRAGKLLYTLTFGIHQRENLDAEILSYPTPIEAADSSSPIQRRRATRRSNLTSSSSKTSTNSNGAQGESRQVHSMNDERRVAETEARSLMPLLELLLPHNASPKSRSLLGQGHVASALNDKGPTCSGKYNTNLMKKIQNGSSLRSADARAGQITRESMTEKPLHVLQNTLITAIFGPASAPESHLDPEIFGETLKCPTDMSEAVNATYPANVADEERADASDIGDREAGGSRDIETADGADRNGRWFVRRMWELVGWDVLARGFASGEPDQIADSAEVSWEEMACEPEEYLV